jgi:hypothetical protein
MANSRAITCQLPLPLLWSHLVRVQQPLPRRHSRVGLGGQFHLDRISTNSPGVLGRLTSARSAIQAPPTSSPLYNEGMGISFSSPPGHASQQPLSYRERRGVPPWNVHERESRGMAEELHRVAATTLCAAVMELCVWGSTHQNIRSRTPSCARWSGRRARTLGACLWPSQISRRRTCTNDFQLKINNQVGVVLSWEPKFLRRQPWVRPSELCFVFF